MQGVNGLQDEIKNITEKCQVCKIYKKPPPRPVVSLPMTSHFQETVSMDLKTYGQNILHLIDVCTCLSAAAFIPNKSRETIIKHIFGVRHFPEIPHRQWRWVCQHWISRNGKPCITVHTTAAEAPWSNGVVERNTQTHMMNKITAETNTSPDLAQTWALNAKNILQNVAAFSTFQLVLGTNPKLTATLSDDLPALSIKPSSQIVQENLNAIHSARAAFVASENSERIRRALLHNVRTSSEVHYRKCDPVQT